MHRHFVFLTCLLAVTATWGYAPRQGNCQTATAGAEPVKLADRLPTLAVKVTDSGAGPLEGVTIGDRLQNQPVSGKDGRMVVQGPERMLGLTFRKDGFITKSIDEHEIRRALAKPDGLVVVLEPFIGLAGQVLAPDGSPVEAFTITAGPGKLPRDWDCVKRQVSEHDGRFMLGLSKEGTTWVGVVASGFAPWEGWIDAKRRGAPLDIRLSPGVTVSCRVLLPEKFRERVKVSLVPRRDKSEIGGLSGEPPAEVLPTRVATLPRNGELQFNHVRPDRYRLIIEGRGVPETARAFDVPATGLDVGTVRIDVPAATGRIEGRVWHPKDKGGGPWAFAKGYIGDLLGCYVYDDRYNTIEFVADENGRFHVNGVPAGLHTVGFQYTVFDMDKSYDWSAVVVEGQTTLVRAFEPDAHRELTLAFAIGDGSKGQYESGTGLGAGRKVEDVTVNSPAGAGNQQAGVAPREPTFRVDLVPLAKEPLSFAQPCWQKLDPHAKLILPDVAPGTYRLRLHDWLGEHGLESGPLFDQVVHVPPGGRGEVRIPLGAGSITGKIPAIEENFERSVEVTAVGKGGRSRWRRARCDDDGNFCVRCLSPGTYTLFIHNPQSGFCRVGDVDVPAGVIDVGERTLSGGATVRGLIEFAGPSRVPDEVVATDVFGVTVRQAIMVYSSFDRFELKHLWPGRWTVSARSGDEVLASAAVSVVGSGAFQVTLTAGRKPNP